MRRSILVTLVVVGTAAVAFALAPPRMSDGSLLPGCSCTQPNAIADGVQLANCLCPSAVAGRSRHCVVALGPGQVSLSCENAQR